MAIATTSSGRDLAAGADDLAVQERLLALGHATVAGAFGRDTGYTLHGYRTHLRLRAVVERLDRGDDDLAGIARDVGFSSHSHLTATFRKTFGVPPSRVRDSARGRRGRRHRLHR